MRLRSQLLLLATTVLAAAAQAQAPTITSDSDSLPPRDGPPLPWAASPESEGFDSHTLEEVQAHLEQLVANKDLPGAVALGARHGHLVLNATAGGGAFSWEGGEPIFRVFSMSKPVVAVLALALMDQGLLSLDDPIDTYLPELANPSVYQGVDAMGQFVTTPAARCATVRELMTHTGGFSYGFDPKHPVDRAYDLAGLADMRDQADAATFLGKLRSIPLFAAPNTTWRYSVSYDLLGVILERITEKPLDAILREHLTGPLNLPDLDFYVPPAKAHRLPAMDVVINDAPYSLKPINEHVRPTFFSGGSGIYSTASDYLRVAQMLLNGGELDGVRILSKGAVQSMLQNHLPPSMLPFYLGAYKGSGFGLGVQITGENEAGPGRPLGEVSWGGYAGTQWFFSPAMGTAIVTMTQRAPIDGRLPGAVKPYFFEALRKGGGAGKAKATEASTPALRGGLMKH